jgi:hypothetical protein
MVSILIREKIKLLRIRNFIFESIFFDIMGSKRKVTAVIMNAHTIYVEIRNIIDRPMIISRKRRLRIIKEYGVEGCYLITKELRSLAIGRILWVRKILIIGILIFAAANLVTIFSDSATIIIEIDILKKIITDFEITVYGNITIR